LVHRDLKSSNLLIDENLRVKLCDFGLSQFKPRSTMLHDDQSARGTPLWMAPEVMKFEQFNEKADIYSFGLVLWELLTRREPFENHKNYDEFRTAVCDLHERPIIPGDTDPSLKLLIEACWHPNPQSRPSAEQIINQLNIILVNVAILKDQRGRHFWLSCFGDNQEVSWDTFKTSTIIYFSLPVSTERERVDLNFRCLKLLLVNSQKEAVSIMNWGRLLQFFGPIKIPSVANGQTIFDDITNICKQPWFHGDHDTEYSKQLLTGKPSGTFMIRFSSAVEGWYTISQIQGSSIEHQRISHLPGEPYIVENNSYASIFDLVKERELTQPCEGSRYYREVNGESSESKYKEMAPDRKPY